MKLLGSHRLFTKLLATYLAVTLVTLTVVALIFVYMMQRYFFSVEGWQLASRGENVSDLISLPLVEGEIEEVKSLAQALSFSYAVHLWVFDEAGEIIAAHGQNPEKLGLKIEEVEIQSTLSGNIVTKQITGPDFNSLFYLLPVLYAPPPEDDRSPSDNPENSEEKIVGAVAISAPLGGTSGTVAGILQIGFYSFLGAIVLSGIFGFFLSRNLAHPLEEMSRVTLEMSRGNFDYRVKYRSRDELGQLADTLNYAVDQVSKTIEEQEKLVRLQKELLSNISHEFKAPLTSLRGFLELMREGKLEGKQDRYLELMIEDVLKLNRQVQDLLDLSRLEHGHITLNLEKLQPEELVHSCLEYFDHKVRDKGVEIITKIPPGLPQINVDQDRLQQVFNNLLENALRYTPGGGTIKISARKGPRDSLLYFFIQDNGKGIPQEALPHIWDRFYKYDRARTRTDTGTGLGLAIVKQIVEMHGGKVTVQSKPDQGSIFGFGIPAAG